MTRSDTFILCLTIAQVIGLPGHLSGVQESAAGSDGGEWNAPGVLELVERGRSARATIASDGELDSYRALTEGYIYFFIDPEEGERALIRVDQVAVELSWAAPDHVQQHIIGERTETRLPVRDFSYYLDRLTLVQYGFGDEIQVGLGMDVAEVPHPLAAIREDSSGDIPYDFRLADSLSLALPGRSEPLRLYDIEVRPRDPDEPGVMGTITLDRASANIVRMAFAFTPASYVDPRTDRVTVRLDYGLWEDRYWLPNLQEIEVRRELPEFDFGVGTVIRAVLRVSDYEMNVPVPDDFRMLPHVTALPEAARRSYPFHDDIYAGMVRDGMDEVTPDPDLRRLRMEAVERLEGRPPSGLSPIRVHVPSLSSAIRYSRAEGTYLGAGASIVRSDIRIRPHLGYAMASQDPQATLTIDVPMGPRWMAEVQGWHRTRQDLGLTPGIAPLFSSLGAAMRGEDYLDPYRSTGAAFRLIRGSDDGSARVSARLGFERAATFDLGASTAPWNRSRPTREMRGIAEGDFMRLDLGARIRRSLPSSGRGQGEIDLGYLGGSQGRSMALSFSGEGRWGPTSEVRELLMTANGWHAWGDALPQVHRLAGGRGTVPGFPYRSFLGRSVAVSSLVASADARGPLLRVRSGLHVGWTGRSDPEVSQMWNANATGGVKVAASIGVGFPWDIVRLDLARGLGQGEWQLLLSLDPRWWDRL